MAVGQTAQQPIQAGISVEPLVTSADPNILSHPAVQQLVDAYRGGVVSADDIIARVGEQGQAQRKALIESLGEFVSPEAIQSRMAAHKLSAAQSNAASSLVEPATALARTQMAAQAAEAVYGKGGLDTFQKLGHLYGETLPTTPDEKDFKKAAQRGNEMAGDMMIADQWLQQIAPVADYVYTDEKGDKFPRKKNWRGFNVTPPNPETGYPGSPAYWAYAKKLDSVLPKFHPARSQYFLDKKSAPSPDDVPEASGTPEPTVQKGGVAVEPLNENQVRAMAVEKLGVDPAQAANMTARDIVTARALLQPSLHPAPAPAPVAAAAPATPATEQPMTPGTTDPEARKQLFEQPQVNDWMKAQGLYYKFAGAAQKRSAGVQNPNNDLELAETYAKMLDPQSTLREFKWEALKAAIPWIDTIKDAKALITKQHLLPPEAINRMVDEGLGMIESHEKAVQSSFQYALQNTPGALDRQDTLLAQGVPFRQRLGFQSEATANTRQPVTLSSGRKLIYVP